MKYTIEKLEPFGVTLKATNQDVKLDEVDIEVLRQLFRKEQLLLLRGFKTFKDSEELSAYCDRWGKVSIWPFGKVLELIQHENPKDHIFDHSYVPLHWDGMYRSQVPEYQIFHCVSAPDYNQGGRTIFSNTILTLKQMSEEFKTTLTRIKGTYKRKMEFYNSKVLSPIVTAHPIRGFPVIRYNEVHSDNNGKLINIPNLEFSGAADKELKIIHSTLKKALYNKENCYAHDWQDGDVVIADNFSLLHGRESFISKSPRHIQRVQVLSNPPFDNPHLETY